MVERFEESLEFGGLGKIPLIGRWDLEMKFCFGKIIGWGVGL